MKKPNKNSIPPQARNKILSAALCATGMSSLAVANPVLNNIEAGNVHVDQTPNTTTVTQTSDKAIINWQSFNIGAQEHTHFQQPVNGIALNRINPAEGASHIFGQLSATGQIILVNPAGIYFGPTAIVNVGGIMASTAGIASQDFMQGHYHFSQASNYHGAIVNEGQIITANHGLVALLGESVVNRGMIEANLGHVVLASGATFTVNFSNDQLINFSVDSKTTTTAHDQNGQVLKDGVNNTGSIIANGGKVLVTAQAASNVLDHVINMQGVTQAQSVYEQNGEIIISGDKDAGVVRIAGNLDASSMDANSSSGNITVTGYNILLDNPALLDASGINGGGNILIGGNYQGNGPLPHANAVVMAPEAKIVADALQHGNGGQVILWSDNLTRAYGSISAQGGAQQGDGGLVETSSHGYLDANGVRVNTLAANGKIGIWLLDPSDLTISTGTTSNVNFAVNTFTVDNNSNTSVLNVSTLTAQLALSNVIVLNPSGGSGTGVGNITVSSPISWASNNSLTLNAANNLSVNSAITWTGTGNLNLIAANNIVLQAALTGNNGTLQLTAANTANSITTSALGTVSVRNFNLLQGQWFQVAASLPTLNVTNNFQINSGVMPNAVAQFIRATSGNGTLVSPYTIADAYGLQGIGSTASTLASHYTLANSITLSTANWNSGSGFVPIGNLATPFTGIFDGLQRTISSLTINAASGNRLGLFGVNNGTLSNLGVINVTITGLNNVGALAGLNQNIISGSYSNGTINGVSTATNIGGLVGNNTGTITNAFSNTKLIGAGSNGQFGGLVGVNSNAISTSYSTGSIVVGTTSNNIGGFLGQNNAGTISDVYSVSPITVGSGSTQVGGLVGSNEAASNINTSYSIGYVSAGSGLVGNNAGTVNNSYWNTNTSGQVSSAAGTGLTSTQMRDQINFTGFDFATVWNIVTNESYPYLRNFYAATPRTISGAAPASSAGFAVNLATAGVVRDVAYAQANNVYYFLEGNNLISNVNNTISDGTPILSYLSGATTKASSITMAPTGGSGALNLDFVTNQISIGRVGINENITSTNVLTALGTLGATQLADILFFANGATGIATNSGTTFKTNSLTSFTLLGQLSGGSSNFTGPLSISGSQAIGSSAVTIANTLDLNTSTLSTSGIATISGTITSSAAGVDALISSGQLTISSSNPGFIGNTRINGGLLQLNNATTPIGTGNLIFNGGASFQIGQNTNFSNNYTINATTVFSGANALTLSGNGTLNSTLTISRTGTTTLSGNLSGTGTLNSGTVTLSGNNAGYSGAIAIGSGANLTLASTTSPLGTGTVSLTNAQLTASINGITISNPLVLSNTANILSATGAGNVFAINGQISGTGSLRISGSGGAAVQLNSSNTYSGATTILSGGILQLNNASAISNTTNVDVQAGGILELQNDISVNKPMTLANILRGAGTWAGNINLSGTSTLTATNVTDTLHVTGTINGSASLNLLGSGTIELAGAVGATTPVSTLTSNVTTLNINTSLMRTINAQTYHNNVLLNTTTNLITTSGSADLIFATGSTINSAPATSQSLALNPGRAITLNNSVIGGTTPLAQFTANSPSSALTISGNINTVNNIVLNASSLNISTGNLNSSSGTVSVTTTGIAQETGSGSVSANNLSITAVGGITFNANNTVNTLTLNNTSSGNVSFTNSTALSLTSINTVNNLTITSSGSITQTGAISAPNGTKTFSSTAANSDILLTNAANNMGSNITFNGTVTNLRDVSLVDGTSTSTSFNFGSPSLLRDLTINYANAATALSALTATGNISVTAGGTISQTGIMTSSGSATFNAGAHIINLNANNQFSGTLSLNNSGNNNVTLNNLNTSFSFANSSIGSGTNTLTNTGGSMTLPAGVTFLSAGSVTLSTNTLLNLSGSLQSTSGSLILSGPAQIINSPSLTANNGNITFSNTVTSTSGSTLNLQNNTTAGLFSFNDNATLEGLVISAPLSQVNFNGTTNVFQNAVNFSNTALVVLGNGNDNFTFNNSFTNTGATQLNGNIDTVNTALSLSTITLNGTSSITTNAGASITLGNILGNQNLTLTSSNISLSQLAVNNLTITGVGANNTFTLNTTNTENWNINTANTGTVSTTGIAGTGNFSNMQNLIGGSNTDTFNFADAASLTGSVDGGLGTNTLNYANYTSPININLATSTATGTSGFSNIQSFIGGSASDILTGANVVNTWNITTNNAGNINSSTTFSSFENLIGGSDNDSFILANGVGVSGTIDGGSVLDTNTLDYSAYNSAIAVNLQTGTATNIGGFSNIQNFVGGSATDTFTMTNTVSAWNISSNNAGDVGTFVFSSFENLIGGTGNDSFTFANGVGVTGTINGGAGLGINTLDYTNYSTAISINLNSLTATGIGGFSNIQDFMGGSATDTFTGANGINTWNITANNTGNVGSSSFSSFENLIGGTNNDTFTFANGFGVSGTIDGAAGTNTLDYSAYTSNIAVNLAAASATGTSGFSNIQDFIGGTAADTFTGANGINTWNIATNNAGNINSTTTFSSFENLTGGTTSDNFVLADGVGISGTINGVGGSDTFDYSAYTSNVAVNLAAASATGTGGFTSIESFIGGSGTNSFTGANATNNWNLTGTASGNLNSNAITFTAFANLIGGTGADTFALANGVTFTGSIDGGAGSNTLSYGAFTTSIALNLSSGTAPNIGAFSNIQSFVGSSASDTLTGFNAANTWNINSANAGTVNTTTSFASFENLIGSGINDNFIFGSSGSVIGTINGAGGTDTFDYSAYTSNVTVNLAAASATGTAGFTSIESFIGGNGNNTLTGDNTATTWAINAINNGSVNGTTAFSQFNNLTGGTNDNTFVFANGAYVTGLIDGGTPANTRTTTLDYTAYVTPVLITLNNNIFSGQSSNSNNTITNYQNINTLIGNQTNKEVNILTLPNKALTITFSPSSHFIGSIDDPVFFNWFNILIPTPPTSPNPVTPNPFIANIIEQANQLYTNDPYFYQNNPLPPMDETILEIINLFDKQFRSAKINQHCG